MKRALFVVLLTSLLYGQLQIRELCYTNSVEVESLSDLFLDEQISKMTGGYTKEYVLAMLDNYTEQDRFEYGTFLVAVDKQSIVSGFLVYTYDLKNTIAEIKMLGVDKKYRGQGIASQLIQLFEKDCLRLCINQALVGVIWQNTQAKKCYIKNGYTVSFLDEIQTYLNILYVFAQGNFDVVDHIGFYMRKKIK